MKKNFTPGNLLAMLVCAVVLAGASRSGAQGTMINGTMHLGEITADNTPDDWTLTANAGDTIVLRIGAVDFTPRLDFYSPDDELLASSLPTFETGSRDASITIQVTNSGTFTVLAQSYFPGYSGTYALSLAEIPGAFEVSPGDEGGVLTNGTLNHATNSLGDLDLWTFTANDGDNIVVRMGTVDFTPQLDVYSPDGALIGSGPDSPGEGLRDASVALQPTNSGTFTVIAQSYYLDDSGPYTLSLAKIPGAFEVSPGDEGGTLTNGTLNQATNSLGDLDLWTFAANAGDSIVVRSGATNFVPRLDIYSPDGTLIGSSPAGPGTGSRDTRVTIQATNSGTFTVLAQSYYPGDSSTPGDSGTYAMSLAKIPGAFEVSPGDEGGVLTNGTLNHATNSLGDLDLWSFAANAGDNIVVRCGTTDFAPQLDIYSPGGVLVGSSLASPGTDSRDTSVTIQATNSGTFTVLVQSFFPGYSGTYALSLAKTPGAFVVSSGDEGGALTNGSLNYATNSLGDLDLWTFTANAGDSIVVRCGTTDFAPQLDLYSPNGALVGHGHANLGTGSRDVSVAIQATNSGTFTVLAQSYYPDESGTYALSLAKIPGAFVISPGDEGGVLTNGTVNYATNSLGDLDMWTFTANAGDSIVVRCGTTDFAPQLDLYSPSGVLIGSSLVGPGTEFRDASVTVQATNSGTFTLLAQSCFPGDSGTYSLSLARIPGDFTVSPGDEGGMLIRGIARNGAITLGDLDMWRLAACQGQLISVNCQELSGGFGFSPRIRLFGRTGLLLDTSTAASLASIDFPAPDTGVYTVIVDGGQSGDSGTYQLTGNGLADELSVCPPVITGTNLNLGVYAGVSNSNPSFVLFTSTNVTTPMALWTPVLTNQFDQYGISGYTNLFNPFQSRQFFRLKQ